MAQDYAVLRDAPAAEREFLEALRLRPQTAGLHLELGELYARAQQWDKAEEQFQLETELQPGSAEALYRLGESLLQLGKFHEARVALVRSDQLKDDMPETLYMLGQSIGLDGDDALAEKSWLHLLKIENNTTLAAQAHFGLAGIYRKQGKYCGRRSRNGIVFVNCRALTTRRTIRRNRPEPEERTLDQFTSRTFVQEKRFCVDVFPSPRNRLRSGLTRHLRAGRHRAAYRCHHQQDDPRRESGHDRRRRRFLHSRVPAAGLASIEDGRRSRSECATADQPRRWQAGISLAASWDPALAERDGREIGRDARAKGVHFMLGPAVNIYRAPMNGRNLEYLGEDPYLASRIAGRIYRGDAKPGRQRHGKHFIGNNSEFDRHNVDSIIDERTLREIYSPLLRLR